MQNILLKREILDVIIPWFVKKELVLIIGPRQAGKTSLLYLIKNELLRQNIPGKNIFYFDLEDFNLLSVMDKGTKEFLRYLEAQGADLEKKNYVLIDEIQYLANPSNFLKLLVDHCPRLKIFASGSSTLEIRKKFKDSLAGRKIIFELLPLNFTEFLIFKGKDSLAELLKKGKFKQQLLAGGLKEIAPLEFHLQDLWGLYEEYIIFGGYPKVVLEKEQSFKIEHLKEIFNTYVRKDIKDIMRVDDVMAFNDLIKLLALNIGQLLNYSSCTRALGMARDTLKKYIFLLENTFVISRLLPYHTNRRKEISKMAKIYFVDTGLRNFVLNDFNAFENRADKGFLLENTVYLQLFKNRQALESIYFWRTIDRKEVDLIFQHGTELIPIEVKSASSQKTNLADFLADYSGKTGVMITPDQFAVKTKAERKIYQLPAACI